MPAVRGARPVRNKEIQDFHWHLDKKRFKECYDFRIRKSLERMVKLF